MQPGTVLRFAKREKYKWLLQPELKAIKEGLIFVEWKHEKENLKYRGYLNAQGQKHGVGFIIAVHKDLNMNNMDIGEWHEDKLHGIAK